VDQGSAYLAEAASVVAEVLSAPGHEVRPLPLPLSELRRRQHDGRFALAIDAVRLIGPTPRHAALSLLSAADPRLAEHPPALDAVDLATIERTLPIAVLGDLALAGAHAGDVRGLDAGDLGNVYRES
jgi:hypothetical protein